MDHYSTLGVSRDADPATIKRAYRAKAKRHHPDAGGDKDKFAEVARAWLVLSNPASRERYDRTGEDPATVDAFGQASAMISAIFMQLLEHASIEHDNLVQLTIVNLKQVGQRAKESRKAAEQKIAKYEKVIKRLSYKGSRQNLLLSLAEQQIRDHRRTVQHHDEELAAVKLAVAYLGEYGYEVDVMQTLGFQPGFMQSATTMRW